MKIGQTWEYKNQLITITNIGDGFIEYMDMTGEELWANTFNITKDNPMQLYVAKGQVWQLEAPSLGKTNMVTIDMVFGDTRNIRFIRANGDTGRITMELFEQIATRIE